MDYVDMCGTKLNSPTNL